MKPVISHSSSVIHKNIDRLTNHLMGANESDGDSNIDPTALIKPVISHLISKFDRHVDVYENHLMVEK